MKFLRKFDKRMFFIIVILVYILMIYPKTINISYPAIRYQLGEENSKKEFKTTLDISGQIKKDFLLNKTFIGYINIKNIEGIEGFLLKKYDDDTYIKLLSSEVSVHLDKYDSGLLEYRMYEKGNIISETIGTIYFNSDYSKVTISLYEPYPKSDTSKHWDGGEGWMLSAPANSRNEGLGISNEVMKFRLYYEGQFNELN